MSVAICSSFRAIAPYSSQFPSHALPRDVGRAQALRDVLGHSESFRANREEVELLSGQARKSRIPSVPHGRRRH
eukprot:1627580-Heterocapsa_arctica.AAC.1